MALKRNLNGQPAFIFYPTRRRNGGPVLSTSTCGQQSGESPCAPPNPALLHLGQSLAWPTSNGCNDRDQTPVGRCQKALERPLRMKGETTETVVYALRAAEFVSGQRGRRSTSNEAQFGALKSHARNQLHRWARLSPMVRSAAFFSCNLLSGRLAKTRSSTHVGTNAERAEPTTAAPRSP